MSKLSSHGILTRKDLISELKVTDDTLTAWEKEGFPCKRIGRTTFYNVEQIKIWIENGFAYMLRHNDEIYVTFSREKIKLLVTEKVGEFNIEDVFEGGTVQIGNWFVQRAQVL